MVDGGWVVGGFDVEFAVEDVGIIVGGGVGVAEVVVSPADVAGEAGDGVLDVVPWSVGSEAEFVAEAKECSATWWWG